MKAVEVQRKQKQWNQNKDTLRKTIIVWKYFYCSPMLPLSSLKIHFIYAAVSHFQEANFHVARGCTKKTGRTRSPAVTCPAVTRMGHSIKCSAMAPTASLLTSLDGQYEEVAISKHWGCHETPMKTVSINMSRGQFNKEIQVYFTS